MTGRPRSCTCGECKRCKHADYMRGWWARQSDEKKRRVLDRRMELRADRIREFDRKRGKRIPDDPAKARVRRAVYEAIKDGRLTREPCEVCGAEPAQGHHEDYSKPLSVRWLCRKHHGEVHRVYLVEAA